MEQQKLPNTVGAIILSIFGILCCCLFGLGIIPAGIGFYLSKKSEKIYLENPELYDNYSQVKTAKIISIIAIVINILMIVRVIYVFATLGWEGIEEQQRLIMEQWELQQG